MSAWQTLTVCVCLCVWVLAWMWVCKCACLRIRVSQCCMTEPAHLSVCCPSVYLWQVRVCSSEAWSRCSDTHLVACCLKNTGLKISPRALAPSRFLEPFWHTRAKCLSRQWRVSQYWGGRLGALAMRRSSWAHSSGFTTSVETDENGREVSETDVKNRSFLSRRRA